MKMRERRLHDLRRSFISIALGDGARGDVMDLYTTLPWPALCEPVSCIKITLDKGKVIALPRAASRRERRWWRR